MATLTLQVRLGISRGWRVRTLNNTKFYNQAVAHCLFIFSSLRARGYKDRIWTMNYTVFATGFKYSIYVEYFLLPLHSSWKRGIQRYFCSAYMINPSRISGRMRLGAGYSVVFKGAPHLRRVAHIRRSSRKKSVQAVNSAIWAWAARARILEVIYREFAVSQDHISSFYKNDSWADSIITQTSRVNSVSPVTSVLYAAKYTGMINKGWSLFSRKPRSRSNDLPFSAIAKNFLQIRRRRRHIKPLVTASLGRKIRTRLFAWSFGLTRRKEYKLRRFLPAKTSHRSVMQARGRLLRFMTICAARRMLWHNFKTTKGAARTAASSLLDTEDSSLPTAATSTLLASRARTMYFGRVMAVRRVVEGQLAEKRLKRKFAYSKFVKLHNNLRRGIQIPFAELPLKTQNSIKEAQEAKKEGRSTKAKQPQGFSRKGKGGRKFNSRQSGKQTNWK